MGCGGSKHAVAAAGEANHRRRRRLLLLSKRLSSFGKIPPAPEESPSGGKKVDGETREAPPVSTLSEKHTERSDSGGRGEREEQEGEKMESRSVQSQDVSPSRCRKNEGQVENLRIQLRQLAEEFTRFEAWGSKKDESPNSLQEEEEEEEDDDDDDEEDRDNPFRTPSTERESSREEESCDQEQDQVQFDEDFSNKIPVYDEYPFDLLQVPIAAGDFCIEGDTTSPHISIEKRESDDGQIEQVRCWRTVEARRLKPGGGEDRKRRIHRQLHGGKIKKHRRRKISAGHRRSSAGVTRQVLELTTALKPLLFTI